jgi:DNA-binding transcriptional MerR regulator
MAEQRQISMAFDLFPEQPVQEEKRIEKSTPLKKPKRITIPVYEEVVPLLVKKSTRGRKSIRVLEQEADGVEIPEDEILFSKQYYAMNEVAAMFKVNVSLLRYWENEFDILKPRKNRKGDRQFRPEDIKNLQLIHYLLRQKKYTLDGAKDYLKNKDKAEEKHKAVLALEKIKSFLLEIKAGL